MELIDYIIIGVIVLIVGGAVAYIIRAKKSGQKCIGCPESKTCGKRQFKCGSDCSACGGSCPGKAQGEK